MKIHKNLAVGAMAVLTSTALFADDAIESGINAYLADDFEKAEAIFERNVENGVQVNDSLLYLARLSLAQGEVEAASDFVERALKIEPNSSDEVAFHAQVLCDSAQAASMFKALKLAKKCIARFEEAVALDDQNLKALMPAVGFHMEAPGIAGGDKDKGEAYLKHLSEISPEHAQTYEVNRLKNEGEIEAALELANSLVAAGVKSERNRYSLARFLLEQKEFDAARDLFESIIEVPLTVDNKWHVVDSIFQLGDSYLIEESDFNKSIELINKYKERNSNTFDVHYLWSSWALARAYHATGDIENYKYWIDKIKEQDYKKNKPFKNQFEAGLKERD